MAQILYVLSTNIYSYERVMLHLIFIIKVGPADAVGIIFIREIVQINGKNNIFI